MLIQPGVYRESVSVSSSGTAAQPIVFRGSAAGVILDGADATIAAGVTAAVGLGLFPDFETLRKIVRVEREFEPQACNAECYDTLYRAYRRLYDQLRGLYREVNEERFRKCRKMTPSGT